MSLNLVVRGGGCIAAVCGMLSVVKLIIKYASFRIDPDFWLITARMSGFQSSPYLLRIKPRHCQRTCILDFIAYRGHWPELSGLRRKVRFGVCKTLVIEYCRHGRNTIGSWCLESY